jgi:hypothetical protein
MRNLWIIILSIVSLTLLTLAVNAAPYKADDTFTDTKPLVLLDFDNKKVQMNNVGGAWGGFDANPADKEAFIRTKYLKDTDLHKSGYVLKVIYDVDSSQSAFNGIWTKLNNLSLKDFQAISITIKGDKEKGFSDFFKIELKDKSTKIEGAVEDISTDWKKIVLPFDQFEGDTEEIDMSNLSEFTIVFEDWKFKQKTGTYYMDDISFIPKKGVTIKYSDIMGATKKNSVKKNGKNDKGKPKQEKEETEE